MTPGDLSQTGDLSSKIDPARPGQAFDAIIEPYLKLPGVAAAALITSDGLLVAAVGEGLQDRETLAAYGGTTMDGAAGLGIAEGDGLPRTVTIRLPDQDLILAPLNADLILVLTGTDIARLSLNL